MLTLVTEPKPDCSNPCRLYIHRRDYERSILWKNYFTIFRPVFEKILEFNGCFFHSLCAWIIDMGASNPVMLLSGEKSIRPLSLARNISVFMKLHPSKLSHHPRTPNAHQYRISNKPILQLLSDVHSHFVFRFQILVSACILSLQISMIFWRKWQVDSK